MRLAAATFIVLSIGVFQVGAVTTPTAALKPGEPAPPFSLKDLDGITHSYEPGVTSPTLLLSVKPGDRYTTLALNGLHELFTMHPRLRNGLNRWIVVSRYDPETDEAFLKHMRTKEWLTLLDPDSTFYVDYKIIATPTVTITGAAGKVAAVHPGYDPGMIQDVRLELADLLDVALPKAVSGTIEAPNMNLQMARRLAERGLYQRALSYYERAAESGPLSPAVQLEIAEVYVKAGNPEQALKVLAPLSAEQVDPDRLNSLRERAEGLRKSESGELTPPKIYR